MIKVFLYNSAPLFFTGILFLFGKHHMHDEIDPSFHYGTDQVSSLKSKFLLFILNIWDLTFQDLW